MKQGTGRTTHSGMKREPISHIVNPKGVSQIGQAMGNHATDSPGKILHGVSEPLYKGRGVEAPQVGVTIHHGGSQRKHT